MRIAPPLKRLTSPSCGPLTLSTMSAADRSFAPATIFAPAASKSLSGTLAATPAPDCTRIAWRPPAARSEEHTSELQSHSDLVCRLLLEKKKKNSRTFLSRLYRCH